MKECRLILLMLILAAMSMIILTGCDDDDDPIAPVAIKPFVSAIIGGDGGRKAEGPDDGGAYVSITQFTRVPDVEVNGSELVVEPEMTIYGGGMGFYGEFELDSDRRADVVVGFGAGKATGTGSILVPGYNQVVGDYQIEVTDFEGVSLAWSSAQYANRYQVIARFNIDYIDNDGVSQYWSNRFSVAHDDTTLTLTVAQMFPPQASVQSITYFSGDLDVMAINGPFVAGESTNIEGACDGVLVSYGRSLDWDFRRDGGSPVKRDADEATVDWTAILQAQISELYK